MYDQFYGLQGRPFQLTPDPHYYFESATHRKALSYLGYGLAQGEGFIVITGDIGAGKTTLVGHLMQTIDPARLTAVKIVSTQVDGDDMLRLAAQSFDLSVDGLSKAAILHQVEAFLHAQARAGRRSLLIVDEAQNIPVSAIEELRMLSNFQLGGQSLLQIFLLGQPEFRDLIKSPELEQLRQRVIATHHLEPMMANEVEPYILHRLAIAGWTGNPGFTPGAFYALYAATGGVPRRLNALVSRVLLLGAIEQLHMIDEDVVDAVVADMGLDTDIAPERVVPSMLDIVAEADAVASSLTTEVNIEDKPLNQVADQEDGLTADFAAVHFVENDQAEGAAIDLDAPWTQPIWNNVDAEFEAEAEVEPEVEAEPEAAEMKDYAALEGFAPAMHSTVTPFARPNFAAFAPPRPVEFADDPAPSLDRDASDAIDWSNDLAEAAEAAVAEQDETAEAERVIEAAPFAKPASSGEADCESAALNAIEIGALRDNMLAEIEALRAEIASLRAVQSHAPFGQPTQPEVDPEALKDCFTLVEERLTALEFRAEEQDTALRRVLTLLVDWVEREEQMAAVQAGVAA